MTDNIFTIDELEILLSSQLREVHHHMHTLSHHLTQVREKRLGCHGVEWRRYLEDQLIQTVLYPSEPMTHCPVQWIQSSTVNKENELLGTPRDQDVGTPSVTGTRRPTTAWRQLKEARSTRKSNHKCDDWWMRMKEKLLELNLELNSIEPVIQ